MNDLRERCIKLRREGHTLPEIVHITRGSKTTVYGYIKEIPLSKKRKKDISVAAGERIKVFATARKGIAKRPIKPFSEWTKEKALLVAHLCFDGEISSRGCAYNNRSKALLKRVKKLMREVYDFEPIFYTNPQTGVSRISYGNVVLAATLKEKAKELLTKARKFPLEHKREVIRAFFDDEGCIDFRPKTNIRRIRGYQKKIPVLHLIKSLLSDLGIEARVQKPNEVVIIGKENLKKFQKEINFSKGVYMNGSRSNSRWKESLEKRVLLTRAIESFKN